MTITAETPAGEVWERASDAEVETFAEEMVHSDNGVIASNLGIKAATAIIQQAFDARDAAKDARIAELEADRDALFDALFDAIAIMGHAMNLSATALIAGEVLKAQDVWQRGHDLLLGKNRSHPDEARAALNGGSHGK